MAKDSQANVRAAPPSVGMNWEFHVTCESEIVEVKGIGPQGECT